MSAETQEWLIKNLRIGFTDERGPAWWANSEAEALADGSHFPGAVPKDEVVRLLDVKLVSAPVFVQLRNQDGSPNVIKASDRQAIVRMPEEDVLGIFKRSYAIHGYNEWINKAMEDIADSPLETAAAGLLRRGGVAFHQVKLPKSFTIAGYGYRPFFTGGTSADGTLASTWFTGVDGAVCDNTFEMARAGATTRLKAKHSKKSHGRLQEIRDRLGLVYAAAEDFEKMVTDMTEVDVTNQDFRLWLDEMVPVPAKRRQNADLKRAKLEEMWLHDPKVAPWSGTEFGILQLDNTFRTWERSVYKSTLQGGRLERNLLGSVSGTSAQEDLKAISALHSVQNKKLVIA